MTNYSKKLLTCLGLVACAATETGNPIEGPNNNDSLTEGRLCDEEYLDIDDPLNEIPDGLDFSPQQALDLIVGNHREDLSWLSADFPYEPGSGQSSIEFQISAAGAPQWVKRTAPDAPPPNSSGIEIGYIEPSCPNWLQYPVTVQIRTDDGALNETVETVVQITTAEFASTGFSLDVAELMGTFESNQPAPDRFILTAGPRLDFQLRFSPAGLTGELSVSSESESNDGTAITFSKTPNLAEFPADQYCGPSAVPLPVAHELRDVSATATLERLNAGFPADLEGPMGGTLSAHFESATEHICLEVPPDGGDSTVIRFEGLVNLESTEGSIKGSIPVRLSQRFNDQGLRTFAEASLGIEALSDTAGRTQSFAIVRDLDFSGYDGGDLRFQVEATSDQSSGHIEAYGLDVADCVTNPPPVVPGATSSPGCRGTDRIEIWSLGWSGD